MMFDGKMPGTITRQNQTVTGILPAAHARFYIINIPAYQQIEIAIPIEIFSMNGFYGEELGIERKSDRLKLSGSVI